MGEFSEISPRRIGQPLQAESPIIKLLRLKPRNTKAAVAELTILNRENINMRASSRISKIMNPLIPSSFTYSIS
jgi:hypothetical protein